MQPPIRKHPAQIQLPGLREGRKTLHESVPAHAGTQQYPDPQQAKGAAPVRSYKVASQYLTGRGHHFGQLFQYLLQQDKQPGMEAPLCTRARKGPLWLCLSYFSLHPQLCLPGIHVTSVYTNQFSFKPGVVQTKVGGSITMWAIHFRAGFDSPCGSLSTQNIMSYVI